ncbi:MAG: HlyD family secretion protein [Chthonomonadales bacterium]
MSWVLRMAGVLVVVAGLGFGGWYVDAFRQRERSRLSGVFEAEPTDAATRLGGRVARILAEEGQRVAEGQAIVVLEARAARDQTAAQEWEAGAARAAWEMALHGPRKEEIAKQIAVLAEAQAALDKALKGPREEEIAAARGKLREAEALYEEAVAGPRKEEIARARAVERLAQARLAAAERGLTQEERSELKAKLDASAAQAILAQADLVRAQKLYAEGAVSKQYLDTAAAAARVATARRKEAEEAWTRGERGTPAEELNQAREAYKEAQASLNLLLAGTRPEEKRAAAARVAAATAGLELFLRGSRPEDIAAARARVAEARAVLIELRHGTRAEALAQARYQRLAASARAHAAAANQAEEVVRAPFSGVVERMLVAVGDLVPPGGVVARLQDPNNLWLRVYVPEKDLAAIHPGVPAELQVDGIRGTVHAVVASVSSMGEFTPANLQTPEERGKQVFAVRLRLALPDARVKPGMAASVRRLGNRVY